MKKLVLFVITSILFTVVYLSVQNTYSVFVKTVNQNITLITTKLEATFLPGEDFNVKIKQLAGNNVVNSNTVDSNITNIVRSNVLSITPSNNNIVSTSDSPFPIYAWFSNGTLYYYTEVVHPYLNSDSSSMFRSLFSLTDLDGLETIDASKATNMLVMFADNPNLSDISGIGGWDVSHVTNMEAMLFLSQGSFNTYGLGKISDFSPIENWNVSSVESMRQMFKYQSMTEIDLSKWNTSSLLDTEIMFFGSSNIEKIDISSFDLSKTKIISRMFNGLTNLKELKTPRVYPNDTSVTVVLPKTLYDSNMVGYTTLGKSTTPVSPTQTWIKEGYTVTLDADGGTVSPVSKIVRYGDTYGNIPNPTKTGYKFLGWEGGSKNIFNFSEWIRLCTRADFGTITKGEDSLTLTSSSQAGYTVTYTNYGEGGNFGNFNSYKVTIKPNTKYTVSYTTTNSNSRVRVFINEKTIAGYHFYGNSSFTFTSPNDAETLRLRFDVTTANTSATLSNVQIEEGDTATEYEPYYVTSNNSVVKNENHTLTAKWKDIEAPTLSLEKWTYNDTALNYIMSSTSSNVSNGVITLNSTNGSVVTLPYFNVNGGKWYATFETNPSVETPQSSPLGASRGSLLYRDKYNNVASETTTGHNYTSNGWSFGKIPLNTWTSQSSNYGTTAYGYDNLVYQFTTDGNYATGPYSVRNFKLYAENMYGGFYIVKANASDNEGLITNPKIISGNQTLAYCQSNGSLMSGSNGEFEYTVTSNGIYTVCVSDSMGNSNIKTIEITRIGKLIPTYPKANNADWVPTHISQLFYTVDGYNEMYLPRYTATPDNGNYTDSGWSLVRGTFGSYGTLITPFPNGAASSNGSRALIVNGSNSFDLTSSVSNGWFWMYIHGGYGSGTVELTNFKLKFSNNNNYTINEAINAGYISPFVIFYNYGNGGATYTFDSFDNLRSGATTTGSYPIVRLIIKVNEGYTLTNINFETNKNWNATNDGIQIGKMPSTFDFSLGPFNSKYWNDNWSGTKYATGELPSVVNDSFHDMSYANNYRIYIRTNQTGKHEACMLYTNDITACFGPNYWDTDASTTLTKMQNELKKQLGTFSNNFSCSEYGTYVECNYSNYKIRALYNGTIANYYTSDKQRRCLIESNGDAYCSNIN